MAMDDTDESISTRWEDLAAVATYSTLDQAHEHGLVILAMRQACWVEPLADGHGYVLHAEPAAMPAILRELAAYEREQAEPNATIRTTEADSFQHGPGWEVFSLWALSLLIAYFWQSSHPVRAGDFSSSSIALWRDGEWWRPFTGLFLHADVAHLLGNLLSGMFFGSLVARSLGPWRAWAVILACGTIGNTLTSAFTYPESFISIGASTAVFGALGILSGLGLIAVCRYRARLPWVKTTAPVLAGVILLGWLGGGDVGGGGNTDVLGHVFGFTSGLIAGILIGFLTPQKNR